MRGDKMFIRTAGQRNVDARTAVVHRRGEDRSRRQTRGVLGVPGGHFARNATGGDLNCYVAVGPVAQNRRFDPAEHDQQIGKPAEPYRACFRSEHDRHCPVQSLVRLSGQAKPRPRAPSTPTHPRHRICPTQSRPISSHLLLLQKHSYRSGHFLSSEKRVRGGPHGVFKKLRRTWRRGRDSNPRCR